MRFSRRLVLALTVATASLAVFAGGASAGTVTPTVTASGTPDIAATVRVVTTTAGLIDLHFSVTQPANICRMFAAGDPNACPQGSLYQGQYQYPNWQAELTISGYAAAGLSYDSANGGWTCSEADGVLSCHIDYLNNYFKTFDVVFTPAETFGGDVSANLVVSDKTAADAAPTSKSQCKDGGWSDFNALTFTPTTYGSLSGFLPVFTPQFKNQGNCVSSVTAAHGS